MAESTSPIIDLHNVSVTFQSNGKSLHAVDQVNLQIQPGDIYGIIGYSGAGKSTLVRTINLLQQPTSGTVTVSGKDLQKLSNPQLRTARKKIGMIFQHFNLLNSRTVLNNVEYPLLSQSISKPSAKLKPKNYWNWSASVNLRNPIPNNCPAAKSNGSQSPGHWPTIRISWSAMKPLVRWTPRQPTTF